METKVFFFHLWNNRLVYGSSITFIANLLYFLLLIVKIFSIFLLLYYSYKIRAVSNESQVFFINERSTSER